MTSKEIAKQTKEFLSKGGAIDEIETVTVTVADIKKDYDPGFKCVDGGNRNTVAQRERHKQKINREINNLE